MSHDVADRLSRALAARGPHYRPRTRHLGPDGAPRFTNRLITSTSPYLLQHAHNPVSWWPWSDEAFAEARRRNVPILMSIGYSTCHWCHVMEHESFEDLAIAALLNARFVPIKVDREERPDIDGLYMTAVQLLTGHGGWPMTVALTPDREPFFGGTYFPPVDGARGARIGFTTVLERLATAYTEDRAGVVRAATELSTALREASTPRPGSAVPGESALSAAYQALARRFEPDQGGFSTAPKFPRPAALTFLLRQGRGGREPHAIHMVTHTLTKMAAGGIHDQLAGGFHRYSTDDEWLVPHFEKMLYDNAQLASVYLEAWQALPVPALEAAARATLEYLERELLTHPSGGEGVAFHSATDADSDGAEGLYFTWTEAELDQALTPDEARLAKSYYGVRRDGHFEGRSVLHRPRTDEAVASALAVSVPELHSQLVAVRARLRAVRGARVPPLLDDKIITEWNAQAISAFARGARALDEPRWGELACRAAGWILTHLRDDRGRLLRCYAGGRAQHAAVLEDYAALIAALLDLLELTGEVRWLEQALELQALQDRDYLDPIHGAYFTSAAHVTDVLVREKPTHDGAQPSGNSVAVLNLLRLAELTEDEAWRTRADAALAALAPALERGALASPLLAAALRMRLDEVPVVVLVTPAGADDRALRRAIATTHLGAGIVLPVTPGPHQDALAARVPCVAGKTAPGGEPTVYVCAGGTCRRGLAEL